MQQEDEAVPVTDWLDQGWKDAVWVARAPWTQLSPAERVMRLINARAGKSPISSWAPGELSRLAGLIESEVHQAIEELISAYRLGAESHPGCQVVLANLPEYVEPPPPTPRTPEGYRAVVVPNRRTGTWTTKLVPIKEATA